MLVCPRVLLSAFAVSAVGCGTAQPAPAPVPHEPLHAIEPVASAPSPNAASSAPARESTAASVVPVVHHGLAWFRDAPAAAFERARTERLPVVVDLWAPWCHTCLSMQHYVLTAEKLPDAAKHFVFLSIDTERAENADFLKTLTLSAWPTFYVLSPEGRVRGRFVGAASPGQFARFLADARRSEALAARTKEGASDPLSALVAADELAARGEFAAAA